MINENCKLEKALHIRPLNEETKDAYLTFMSKKRPYGAHTLNFCEHRFLTEKELNALSEAPVHMTLKEHVTVMTAVAEALIDTNKLQGFLAFWDDEPVGFCGVGVKSNFTYLGRGIPKDMLREGKNAFVISDLVTAPAYRNQGVASALVKEALRYAESGEFSIVECCPSIEFETSALDICRHILENVGFSIVYSSKECCVCRLNLR